MKIALATPLYPKSPSDALTCTAEFACEAASQGARIICFPETYLPGYPGFGAEKADEYAMKVALDKVCLIAAEHEIAIVMPMDWYKGGRLLNVAQVVSATGELLGYQTKNQLDPSEDDIWSAGTERKLFEIEGLTFGITICHEGFRYPESVRWAAAKGAQLVFHPHFTGSDIQGTVPQVWGDPENPYYEKAMMMRALENTIYFASVGYATRYPESASTVVAPDGKCLGYQPYTQPGVLTVDIDPVNATGLLARRFKPEVITYNAD